MGEKNQQPSAVIRAFMAEALENPHMQVLQKDLLNGALGELVFQIEPTVQKKCTAMFNEVAGFLGHPEDRADMIAGLLITGNFNPVTVLPIRISSKYTNFSATDVTEMDGYKRIHLAARKADVAVRIVGLTQEEKLQPSLVVDISKTYEEGRADSRYGYPEMAPEGAKMLPAPPPKAKPQPRRFKI